MKENSFLKNLSVYAQLSKYKLSLAVVLSSLAGYYLQSNTLDFRLPFLAVGIFFLASGSAVLNQYTERFFDAKMERTRNRPIPSNKISPKKASLIAFLFLLTGSTFLYIIGIIPFILGIITVVLYNICYTRLKRKTLLSILPGALVGAIPPLIGFFSAGGTVMHQNIIAFSLFMFIWQLPHFWLINIKYGDEYKAVGFVTISNFLTEIQIRYLVFFWVLFSTSLLLLFCLISDSLNIDLFFFLALLNITFIFFFYILLFQKKGSGEIRNAFILINSFGLFIMILLIVSAILNVN
jgi:heme o synthase